MSLLPFHIACMVGSALSMAAGITVARFYRSKKWWLKTHRLLNLIGAGLALCGLSIAFIMVQASGGPHLRVSHGIFGALTLILVLVMPALGFSIFRSKDKKRIAALKRVHRWTGRLTILAMAGTAVAGLILIGFIPL
jgi:hypothetical protein